MKQKKLIAVLILVAALAAVGISGAMAYRSSTEETPSAVGEGEETAESAEGSGIETEFSAELPEVSDEDAAVYKYVINGASSIEDDFNLLGIAMPVGDDDLALADLCCLFPDENVAYLYFRMPQDTEEHSYRMDAITIDSVEYRAELLAIDRYYQKYQVKALGVTDSGEYNITKVHFVDVAEDRAGQTLNTDILVTASMDDERFTYNQENHYRITLKGENFRSIFQFNKNNNAFVDFWSNLIVDTDRLDLDKRAFFYFAFTCYDEARGISFVPEDILQLVVEYTRLTYEYEGTDQTAAENITPESKTITQTIEPDEVKVIADNEKRSNKRIYQYHTINRLSEADLSKNSDSNSEVLRQVAKEYDWAVQFGESQGYPERDTAAGLFKKTYDICRTDVADFKTISITYRYEQEEVTRLTNSLVKDDTQTVVEKVRKATREEKNEYEKEAIRQDESLNGVEKAIAFIQLMLKPLVIMIVVIAVAAAVIYGIYFIIKWKIKNGE